MNILRSIWFWSSCIIFFLLFSIPATLSFFVLLILRKKTSDGPVFWGQVWSKLSLILNGVRSTSSLPAPIYEPGIVYLSNHQSIVDILVLTKHLPLPFHFVAKDSLFKVPIFGQIMKIAGFFPINRDNPRKALATINAIADKVKTGHAILLFPEGTRSQDGSVGEFKSGFLKILEKSNATVKMVYINGTFPLIKKGTLQFTPGPVMVSISEAIRPEQYQNLAKEVALKFFREKMIDLSNH